jgi:hypothetical protein
MTWTRNGKPKVFIQHPLPGGAASYRYCFFGGGAKMEGMKALQQAHLQAQVFEMDVPFRAFDTLAEEIMAAIEKLVAAGS